jgi:hypothetical protein
MTEAVMVIGGQNGMALPAFFAPDANTAERVIEFFTAQIRNPNTRKAYARATGTFAAWCVERGIGELGHIRPVHVAAYVEGLQQKIAAPSVKLQLAALRMLFNWLVVSQVIPTNPAHAVRGPKHVVKKGKTPVLSAEEARMLIDAIGTDSLIGLRDRALIGLMVYTFARVGAVTKMRGKMSMFKAAGPGCACMKKEASVTRCPATIILNITLRPISQGQGLTSIQKGIYSARHAGAVTSFPKTRCTR